MINSILFFGDYPNEADPTLSVFFQTLIHAIADKGIQCTVISPVSMTKYREKTFKIPYRTEEKTQEGKRITVYHPKYFSFSSKVIGKIDTHTWTVKHLRRAAERTVKKEALRFDATYGHFINIGGISACRIGHRYHVPSFVANGESDLNPSTYNYDSKYDLKPFINCSGVISVSTKNKNELIERKLIDPQRITVIPNSIDETIFKPLDQQECRKRLGLPEDKFIVGFVGGFSERKGYNRILEAARDIPECHLAFCGKGATIPEADNIVFCDSLPHDQIPVFLNAIDVFVLPTLNEGCCNAVLEAMACGKAIVSSDREFNYDILNKDEAMLVDPTDVNAIKEAIIEMKQNEEERHQLGEAALKKSQQFTIHERARKIIEYMEHVRQSR